MPLGAVAAIDQMRASGGVAAADPSCPHVGTAEMSAPGRLAAPIHWIVLGGSGRALAWSPRTNNWRSLDQIPDIQTRVGVGVAGGALYVVGGITAGAGTTAVQEYSEIDCAPPTPTPTPTSELTATRPPGATATPPATSTVTQGTGPSPTATSATPGACHGDCDGDGAVSVADLIKGVAIALDLQPLDVCTDFDADHDGSVRVSELISAVNHLLSGCP